MKKEESTNLFNRFPKSNIFLLVMALVMIFLADTYQLDNVDPDKAAIWKIILSFISVFIICITAYLMNLAVTKKINRIFITAIVGGLAGAIIPMGILYVGFQGAIAAIYFIARGVLFGCLFALVYDWYRKAYREKELEKQNVQSELVLLKNQINPHFLFNSLNNIDSLIKSNPDKASATLVELSDMMRYMIYETNIETVPLKQELDHINNYLNLQKLQYANLNLVSYKISGNVDNKRIAPMLFIPFIENAFKHCTDKEKENAIKLSFEIINHTIVFTAINIADKKHRISKDKSSGVGLEIIKRRLELLYPDKYQLIIKEENDLFCVSLSIRSND